ncbi:hypothetical protein [Desmospora activa]|uniref:Uncharacterized protein n=1 Tax=Desmospora activa DSM 45169 TaxID=1121389 RepID=A0A2T4Z6Y6_9BACL|nr:hypothetical protein [Desmospora activa]PTM57620.1 hypothetical protein C8J48_0170 [Desmospora activa DSM 45169]
MRVEINLTRDEYDAAVACIERRYRECRRKLMEGDRLGRSIKRYRDESLLLERVLEELLYAQPKNDPMIP